MPAYLRYDIIDAQSITPVIHEFQTELGLRHFCRNSLPAQARNLSMWWENPKDTFRQKPTMAFGETLPKSAWEEVTGRPIINTSCPIEIVSAKPARRRIWNVEAA
jgi:hypothetical protein